MIALLPVLKRIDFLMVDEYLGLAVDFQGFFHPVCKEYPVTGQCTGSFIASRDCTFYLNAGPGKLASEIFLFLWSFSPGISLWE